MAEHNCGGCRHGKTIPPGLFVAAANWRALGRENKGDLPPPMQSVVELKSGFYLKEKAPNIAADVKEFRECTQDKKVAHQGGAAYTGVLKKHYYGEDCPYWEEKED